MIELRKIRRTSQPAAVTIELSLTMVMAAAIAIIVVVMFSQSVNAMLSSSKAFKNILNNGEKVALLKNNIPSITERSQINIQITASQGIERISATIADALTVYEEKINNNEQLSAKEELDYARQLLALYTLNRAILPSYITNSNGTSLAIAKPEFVKDYGKFNDEYYIDIHNKQFDIDQRLKIEITKDNNKGKSTDILNAQSVLTELSWKTLET